MSCRTADQQSRRKPNEFVLPIDSRSESSKLEFGWKIDGLSNRFFPTNFSFPSPPLLSTQFLNNKSTFVLKKHLEWCLASSFVAAFCLLFESSICLRRMRMRRTRRASTEHIKSNQNRKAKKKAANLRHRLRRFPIIPRLHLVLRDVTIE